MAKPKTKKTKDKPKDIKAPLDEEVKDAKPEEKLEKVPVAPKADPKPEPQKPESDLPLINLKVYCDLSGLKFDQIAGFRRYAANQKLGPMTVPQWRGEYEEFLAKPMR